MMRWINLQKLNPPQEWMTKANAAKQLVASGAKQPKDLSSVWTELKDSLAAISFGKCWYCELKQIRSDKAVDHFRPKSLYPWLAFDHLNFRYSCTFCNCIRTDSKSGETAGKGNNFPLVIGCNRATNQTNLRDEQYVLIDPCLGSEAGLIDFDESGLACVKYKNHATKKERAEQSIYYYHLNHSELVELRRRLALEIKSLIDEAEYFYHKMEGGIPDMQTPFQKNIQRILEKIQESAELSVFAKRIVQGYGNKEWIDDVLQCA